MSIVRTFTCANCGVKRQIRNLSQESILSVNARTAAEALPKLDQDDRICQECSLDEPESGAGPPSWHYKSYLVNRLGLDTSDLTPGQSSFLQQNY